MGARTGFGLLTGVILVFLVLIFFCWRMNMNRKEHGVDE